MISLRDAVEKFEKKNGLEVKEAFSLISGGKKYYLFNAPAVEGDLNGTFYTVDERGGISAYNPTADLENFSRALRRRL